MTQLHQLNPIDHDRSDLQGSSAGWKTCHYDDDHHCCFMWYLLRFCCDMFYVEYDGEEDDDDDLSGWWIDSSLVTSCLNRTSCNELSDFHRFPILTYHTTIGAPCGAFIHALDEMSHAHLSTGGQCTKFIQWFQAMKIHQAYCISAAQAWTMNIFEGTCDEIQEYMALSPPRLWMLVATHLVRPHHALKAIPISYTKGLVHPKLLYWLSSTQVVRPKHVLPYIPSHPYHYLTIWYIPWYSTIAWTENRLVPSSFHVSSLSP